jgi:hypothetical protein
LAFLWHHLADTVEERTPFLADADTFAELRQKMGRYQTLEDVGVGAVSNQELCAKTHVSRPSVVVEAMAAPDVRVWPVSVR